MHLLAVVLASLLAGTAAAEPVTWRMDPAASSLAFAASFEGAPARGVFRTFDVTVRLDDDVPSRVEVAVAVPSADMGSDDVNRAIRGADWFDAQRFPVATFSATEVQRAAPGRYVAVGTLTLKGTTRPVRVPFAWSSTPAEATMKGELVVDRAAFGVGIGEWRSTAQVSGDVTVQFDVRLRRNR